MYERQKYLDKIKKYLEKEKLILLLGTRQVGKTTILEMLQQKLYGIKYFYSFEDDFYNLEFKSKNDFIDYFSLNLGVDFYKDGYFFIDEFQYVKSGEKILKSLYDDKNIKLKFIVTGSGLWTYNEENKGTLVGRGKEIFIYPFDFFEFLEFKGLNIKLINLDNPSELIINSLQPYYEEFLNFGGYPAVVKAKTINEKIEELEKIVLRYLQRDVSFFLKEKELIDFKKFFSYLYSQVGNLVKKEFIGEYLGIKAKKIEKYLSILEKTMFIYRVYPFFTDKSKEYSGLPKIYFGDIGVINFLEKSFSFRENNGKIVENFVFNELQKNRIFSSDEIKIYKKISKSEIDFIYEGYNKFVPIEVKSGNKRSIPKIFFSFEKVYGDKTTKYITTTKSIFKKDYIGEKELVFCPNFFVGKMI